MQPKQPDSLAHHTTHHTMHHTTHRTPLGQLTIVTHNGALVTVGLPGQHIAPPHPQSGHTQDTDSPLETSDPLDDSLDDPLSDITRQLDEYFNGQRTTFNVNTDLSATTEFRRTVLEHLTTIPYGRTQTYAQIAQAIGRPRAVRAVGSACATNPVPIIIPCHRVLRSDGTLGGYAGGLNMKRTLLELEQ